MKKTILGLILALISLNLHAQPKKSAMHTMSNQEIADRLALKNLVDTFSTLADQKETQHQTLLYTQDATSETFVGGRQVSVLLGRKEIGDAFARFLATFETVYHINGQQTVTLNGDKATGTSYCLVTLIGMENGKKMKTTIGPFTTMTSFARTANGSSLTARPTFPGRKSRKCPTNQPD